MVMLLLTALVSYNVFLCLVITNDLLINSVNYIKNY